MSGQINHPNFFVIGAAKCGTTTLYDLLEQHPSVYMSPIKEPHHFCKDITMNTFSEEYLRYIKSRNVDLKQYLAGDMKRKIWEWYIEDYNDYLKLFKNVTNEQSIGEISNGYLFSKVAAQEIVSTYPNAKIIAIIRNPIERAYSHYLANVRDGRTTLSFREELMSDSIKSDRGWCISHNYIEMGLYYEQLSRFFSVFPQSQIKIYLNDELKHHTNEVAQSMFNFLGIENKTDLRIDKKQNEAKMPKNAVLMKFITQTGLKRKIYRSLPKSLQEKVKPVFFKSGTIPKILEEDKQWLRGIYVDDIKKTGELIGKGLSHWL